MDDPFFGALGDGDLTRAGPLDVDRVFDLQPFAAERDRAREAAGEVDRVGAGARVGGEDLPRRLPSPETPESLGLVTVKVCAA